MTEPMPAVQDETPVAAPALKEQHKLYHVRFREGLQPKAASAKLLNLARGEIVMVQTDHGPEPAHVCGPGVELPLVRLDKPLELLVITRRAQNDDLGKYQNLLQREQEAWRYCQGRIQALGLEMKLLQVERYFNGSKVIFYFSAETRVDFRDLVKSLVQEFRTRVEMRQIGVRHETQMLGGIGCCGRELCCSLFMKDFVPVSIKMAKEQDLPLNPAKISGVCNRLLCCLTHEYETYKALKKGMPKVGRAITFEDRQYKVNHCKTLDGTVSVTAVENPTDTRILTREEWEGGVSVPKVKGEESEERQASSPATTAAPVRSRQEAGHRFGPAGRPPMTAKPPQAAGKPPAPGKRPPVPPPGQKPVATRSRGGNPNVNKVEGARPVEAGKPVEPGKPIEPGKPNDGKPTRSRRSRGRKKGKTP